MTSGVITALGLMVGLHSGTHSKLVVVGAIISIAIADPLSDAVGIHVSEKSKGASRRQIWVSTLTYFLSEFLFEITFLAPVLIFELSTAVIVAVAWGLAILSVLSYHVARSLNQNPARMIAEHLLMAVFVVTATHFLGEWVSRMFRR